MMANWCLSAALLRCNLVQRTRTLCSTTGCFRAWTSMSTSTTTSATTTKESRSQNKTGVPVIRAEPRVALFDEKIKIELNNLPSNEKITLHGESLMGESKVMFASCGHYLTDGQGRISVSDQSSTGGTYTGLEPMGLLWSIQCIPGSPRPSRILTKTTGIPSLLDLKAYPGHLQIKDIYGDSPDKPPESLADLQLERWFRFPSDVTRVQVRSGKLRGAFYIPSGDGPFQGVIEMTGMIGGIIEHRAALLASRGFAVFALPYFRYQDLPTDIREITLDYFEDAVNWLMSHPKVYSHGVGVLGSSKGCELACCMGSYLPQVKCVVGINGSSYLTVHDLRHKGELLIKGFEFDPSLITKNEDGDLVGWPALMPRDDVIPAWRQDTNYLIVASEDDEAISIGHNEKLLEAWPQDKRQNVEMLRYPGAGHIFNPPYTPLCRSSFLPYLDGYVLFGGRAKEQAYAQEDAWARSLQFLKTHIPTTSS